MNQNRANMMNSNSVIYQKYLKNPSHNASMQDGFNNIYDEDEAEVMIFPEMDHYDETNNNNISNYNTSQYKHV